MVNVDHEPSDAEDQILDVMKDGRERGEPWGYTTPNDLHERGDIPSVDFNLRRLKDAGWITLQSRGFYRFVNDPREEHD